MKCFRLGREKRPRPLAQYWRGYLIIYLAGVQTLKLLCAYIFFLSLSSKRKRKGFFIYKGKKVIFIVTYSKIDGFLGKDMAFIIWYFSWLSVNRFIWLPWLGEGKQKKETMFLSINNITVSKSELLTVNWTNVVDQVQNCGARIRYNSLIRVNSVDQVERRTHM